MMEEKGKLPIIWALKGPLFLAFDSMGWMQTSSPCNSASSKNFNLAQENSLKPRTQLLVNCVPPCSSSTRSFRKEKNRQLPKSRHD